MRSRGGKASDPARGTSLLLNSILTAQTRTLPNNISLFQGGAVMGADINGQTSQDHPAVVYDGNGLWHMLFRAQDSSNRLLYATSSDGQSWGFVGQVSGESTGSAPAIALSQGPTPTGFQNYVVAIYVANDSSNRILYSILNLEEDVNTRNWRPEGQIGGESAQQVFAAGQPGSTAVNVYFLANDSSDRLLEHQFTPPQP
jgi:hypothetical protein